MQLGRSTSAADAARGPSRAQSSENHEFAASPPPATREWAPATMFGAPVFVAGFPDALGGSIRTVLAGSIYPAAFQSVEYVRAGSYSREEDQHAQLRFRVSFRGFVKWERGVRPSRWGLTPGFGGVSKGQKPVRFPY